MAVTRFVLRLLAKTFHGPPDSPFRDLLQNVVWQGHSMLIDTINAYTHRLRQDTRSFIRTVTAERTVENLITCRGVAVWE